MKNKDRDCKILKARKRGFTLEYIGNFWSISRQRVHQIVVEQQKLELKRLKYRLGKRIFF